MAVSSQIVESMKNSSWIRKMFEAGAELAAKYGTPLYVMDEEMVRSNCRRFRDSMKMFYGEKGEVHYAGKAFSCMEMCRIVASEEIGLDAVSIGELYTALKAGFPMEDRKSVV